MSSSGMLSQIAVLTFILKHMKKTKEQFHQLLQKDFAKVYQDHVFEETLQPLFNQQEAIEANKPIRYHIAAPVEKDMFALLVKTCQKIDCHFVLTEQQELHFLLTASDKKRSFFS